MGERRAVYRYLINNTFGRVVVPSTGHYLIPLTPDEKQSLVDECVNRYLLTHKLDKNVDNALSVTITGFVTGNPICKCRVTIKHEPVRTTEFEQE